MQYLDMAGRYLLTIAGWMGGQGAISFIASWQMHFNAGFPPLWWAFMVLPVNTAVALTGWCYYRYRETRALTMSQFFEMRYNRGFRIFTGCLNWFSGILNFGIFPAAMAHFYVYFCGLKDHIFLFHMPALALGGVHIHAYPVMISTIAPIMLIGLGLSLLFVTQGGQISVMVTECAQGMFSSAAFIIIGASVIMKLHWPDVVQAMQHADALATGKSMLHPFHTQNISDYNIWFYLIMIFGNVYAFLGWLGTQGFYCSARTPHEQKMGNILMVWRLIPQNLVVILLPIAAFTIMNLAKFAGPASEINHVLNGIANPAVKNQMQTPVAMAYFLPFGVKGLLATIMLFFSFTSHDTYMHSWGSIFVQDVHQPIAQAVREGKSRFHRFVRRIFKPVAGTAEHIRMLRKSIVFVAIFGFFFSWVYPQSDQILMFFAITGAISFAGIGSVIIGGLYWRKGTTIASYAAMCAGVIVGVGGVVIGPYFDNCLHKEFPINGQWLSMIAMLMAISLYCALSSIEYRTRAAKSFSGGVGGAAATFLALSALYNWWANVHHGEQLPYSLVFITALALLVGSLVYIYTSPIKQEKQAFNLDKLLHRGKYIVASDQVVGSEKPLSFVEKVFGITEEFTLPDKIQAIFLVAWQTFWFLIFIGAAIWNYAFHSIPNEWFAKFWYYYIWQFLITAVPITIWFQIGGMKDIRDMYRLLSVKERDAADDGSVVREPEAQVPEYVPELEPATEMDGGKQN